ncbi:MAG TPA: PDZ domain-containing protein, partial [Bacteroidota bacterium]|nr:PDZ domain-containing protein [Bacteroidota bacterium]
MKALSTLAVILLFAGATVVSAGESAQKQIVKKSVKTDKQDRSAWLGVALGDRTEHSSEAKSDSKKGAVVKDVVDDSPADSIGMKEEDIIIELNGKAVTDAEDVVTRIGAMKPGEKVSIVVQRDDAKKTFTAVLGSRPRMQRHIEMRMPKMQMEAPSVPHGPFMMDFASHTGVEGMKLMELRDQLGKYFEAPDGKALLVTEVKKNSNARKAGIEAGDVITKIGTTDIEDMSDLHQALREAKEDTTVSVELIRKGVHKTVKLAIS